MQVSSYQMHNVLNHYSRRLSRRLLSQDARKADNRLEGEPVEMSPGDRQRAGRETVSKQIFNKIKEVVSRCRASQPSQKEIQTNDENLKNRHFVYNVIDPVNHQKTNRRVIDDSSFVMKRLDKTEANKVGSKLAFWG